LTGQSVWPGYMLVPVPCKQGKGVVVVGVVVVVVVVGVVRVVVVVGVVRVVVVVILDIVAITVQTPFTTV